jgi:predicted ATP-binding protein involved in virulence
MSIERFQIFGLYGFRNFDIKIKDNKLILVGENGSGKTTILRLFFYFLSGRWESLNKYKFEKLIITINVTDFKLTQEK